MAYLAALFFLFQASILSLLWRGKRKMTEIPMVPSDSTAWPSITIIVPARNEAATIEVGLQSLMRLDYPALRFVVVNDRSTDATGEILARLAGREPRITPLTVTELPAGWLGKNHAIHLAVGRSESELVLFTDADVQFAPDCLKRMVTLLQRDQLDHLTALPGLIAHGALLRSTLGAFSMSFTLFVQPWKNKNPRSKSALGVGAFNLLRRTSYLTVGGHQNIPMRPDDDLALGRLVKLLGLKSDCVDAVNEVRVEWYPSAWELARGLEKNAVSAFNYSVVGAGTAVLLLNPFFFLLPLALPFLVEGTARGFAWAALGVFVFNYAYHLRAARLSLTCLALLPVAGIFICFVSARAVVLTFWRGGIIWRGTFYPLSELKKNRSFLNQTDFMGR